jgi:hypothetical protein
MEIKPWSIRWLNIFLGDNQKFLEQTPKFLAVKFLVT